jgi:hypothetical protein
MFIHHNETETDVKAGTGKYGTAAANIKFKG